MGDNAQQNKPLVGQTHGDDLLQQLKQGWAPLPTSTLFSMAIGGLKVRLMRSVVTMLSIVLAIAFLTYTGLTNFLQKNLVDAVPKYMPVNPISPTQVRDVADDLSKLKVVTSLDLSRRIALASELGLGETDAQKTEIAGISGQIRAADDRLKKAEDVVKKIKSDPKSTRGETLSAEGAADKAKQSYNGLVEREKELATAIALGDWIRTGKTDQATALEPMLNKTLTKRYEWLVLSLPNQSRLTAGEIKSLSGIIDLTAASGATQRQLEMARKAIADEIQKRQLVELQSLMRTAGVSTNVSEKATRMEVWLIVMALLTCAVGIANAMLMSVTERFREIGTMKCLGAQDNLVVKLFLLESAFLGIIGAAAGIVLGVSVSLLAAFAQFRGFGFSEFPGAYQCFFVIGLSVAGGVFLSVSGAVYPAYSASRMRPVDALRVDE